MWKVWIRSLFKLTVINCVAFGIVGLIFLGSGRIIPVMICAFFFVGLLIFCVVLKEAMNYTQKAREGCLG